MFNNIYVLSIFSTFVKTVSAFLISVILARAFDLSDYGNVYYYVQLVNFSGLFFSLGLGQSILYRIKQNLISSRRAYSFTLIHTLLASALFTLILVIISSDYKWSLIAALTFYVAVQIVSFLKMQDDKGIKRNVHANIISASLHLGLIFILMQINLLSVHLVILAFTFSLIVKLAIVMPWHNLKFTFHYDFREYKFSLPFFANAILLTGLLRLDIFILKYFLPETEIGIYAVTLNVAEIALLLPSAIGSVLYPLIVSRKDNDSSKNEGMKVLFLNLIFSLGISLILLFFTKYFVVTFYGDSYLRSVRLIFFLLPGIIALSSVYSTSNTLSALGKVKFTSIALFFGLIFNVLILTLGVRSYGLAIAPISSSIAYSLVAIFMYIGLRKFNL